MKIQCTDGKTFELINGSGKTGELLYNGHFSFGARVNIGSEKYDIKPAGIFSTTIAVLKNEVEEASMKMTWKGQIVISFRNGEEFVLKAKGAFLNKYVIEDITGKEILLLSPSFNWARLNYAYTLSFEVEPKDALLVLLSVYSANYFIAAMSATI